MIICFLLFIIFCKISLYGKIKQSTKQNNSTVNVLKITIVL